MPQGVCGNGNSKGYSLTGQAGDTITIRLESDTGGAVFSVFGPNGELLADGSAKTFWSGKLTSAGNYRINVYTSRSYTPFTIKFTRRR